MLLAVAVAFRDAARRRFADVFLSLGWLHLALIAQRNLPLFAIAASPAVARAVAEFLDAGSASQVAGWLSNLSAQFRAGSASFEETDRIGRVHFVSAFAISALSAVLLLTPAGPGVLNSKIASTYDPASYPEKALSLLKSPESQRIFAEDEWGDYLIYSLYPSKKVFIDGRSDFYGDAFGEKYLDLINVKWGWQQTLDKYGIDTIAISPKFALSSTLKISPDWRLVYDDKVSLIFRRTRAQQVSPASNGGELAVIAGSRNLNMTARSRSQNVIAESPNQPLD
jgi:hypothetical protein